MRLLLFLWGVQAFKFPNFQHVIQNLIPKVWSEWSEMEEHCSKTCGFGTRCKTRTCLPTKNDNDCKGDSKACIGCNFHKCGVSWGPWSTTVGECTKSCGGGYAHRTRPCLNDITGEEVSTGHCPGRLANADPCNTDPCPTWGEWSIEIGGCTWPYKCESGKRCHTRTCETGNDADCGNENTTQCLTTTTAEPTTTTWPTTGLWYPAKWHSWELWAMGWTDCTVSCGGGTRKRSRMCIENGWAVSPSQCDSNSDEPVPALPEKCHEYLPTDECKQWMPSINPNSYQPYLEVEECNTSICVQWSEWSELSTCSSSCGFGQMCRTRTCSTGNDDDCAKQGDGATRRCTGCNPHTCGASWGSWEGDGTWNTNNWAVELSECTKTCGGGKKYQIRPCYSENGDRLPSGMCPEPLQKRSWNCNTHTCPTWALWEGWSTCSYDVYSDLQDVAVCGRKRKRRCYNSEKSTFVGCSSTEKTKTWDTQSKPCKQDICGREMVYWKNSEGIPRQETDYVVSTELTSKWSLDEFDGKCASYCDADPNCIAMTTKHATQYGRWKYDSSQFRPTVISLPSNCILISKSNLRDVYCYGCTRKDPDNETGKVVEICEEKEKYPDDPNRNYVREYCTTTTTTGIFGMFKDHYENTDYNNNNIYFLASTFMYDYFYEDYPFEWGARPPNGIIAIKPYKQLAQCSRTKRIRGKEEPFGTINFLPRRSAMFAVRNRGNDHENFYQVKITNIRSKWDCSTECFNTAGCTGYYIDDNCHFMMNDMVYYRTVYHPKVLESGQLSDICPNQNMFDYWFHHFLFEIELKCNGKAACERAEAAVLRKYQSANQWTFDVKPGLSRSRFIHGREVRRLYGGLKEHLTGTKTKTLRFDTYTKMKFLKDEDKSRSTARNDESTGVDKMLAEIESMMAETLETFKVENLDLPEGVSMSMSPVEVVALSQMTESGETAADCSTGTCECNVGFVDNGDGCVPDEEAMTEVQAVTYFLPKLIQKLKDVFMEDRPEKGRPKLLKHWEKAKEKFQKRYTDTLSGKCIFWNDTKPWKDNSIDFESVKKCSDVKKVYAAFNSWSSKFTIDCRKEKRNKHDKWLKRAQPKFKNLHDRTMKVLKCKEV